MLLHGFSDPQTTVDVDCECVAEIVYSLFVIHFHIMGRNNLSITISLMLILDSLSAANQNKLAEDCVLNNHKFIYTRTGNSVFRMISPNTSTW